MLEKTRYCLQKEIICGMKMKILIAKTSNSRKSFFIGVQVSKLLHRQTYNVYQSLKRNGVKIVRASPQEIGYLIRTKTIPASTHSVSLVEYEGGLRYIYETWKGVPSPVIPSHFRTSTLLRQSQFHHHHHHHHPSDDHSPTVLPIAPFLPSSKTLNSYSIEEETNQRQFCNFQELERSAINTLLILCNNPNLKINVE
jgi:hypothetical protein